MKTLREPNVARESSKNSSVPSDAQIESTCSENIHNNYMILLYLLQCFRRGASKHLDLAQLVEHTTVTVTQRLYGRWFDSGSRDVAIPFAVPR